METIQNGVIKTQSKSAISLDRIYAATFQKEGTETAQLRQMVTAVSIYPSKKVSNSLNDSLFDISDFGFTSKTYTAEENRVAFIPVPVGTVQSQVEELLKQNADACIYRILDNRPIVSEDQLYAINMGQRTMDDFANQQVVRYPDSHESAGQIVLDPNGKVQYRGTFFSKKAKADVDNRKKADDYGYVSPEIKAELEGDAIDATLVKDQGLA